MANPLWSKREQVERLGELIDKGLSASQAAEAMGHRYTRNAVLGKAFRLGWSFGTPRTPEQKAYATAARKTPQRTPTGYVSAMIHVACAFDPETYAQIVAHATKHGISAPAAIRELVEWGLEA
jgi:hypothetical protein